MKPNPLDTLRRSLRRRLAFGMLAIGGTSVWALWPLEVDRGPAVGFQISSAPPLNKREALKPEAFAVRLWHPSPAPPAAAAIPPPPIPPPPIKLQLIGILKPAGADEPFRAALYDPETDTLHIVAAGEELKIGSRGRTVTIASFQPESVELADGQARLTLSLRPPGGTP